MRDHDDRLPVDPGGRAAILARDAAGQCEAAVQALRADRFGEGRTHLRSAHLSMERALRLLEPPAAAETGQR